MSKKMRLMSPATLKVRLAFPQSGFTKKGPGVVASMRAAFNNLRPQQKVIAAVMGWVPTAWAWESLL